MNESPFGFPSREEGLAFHFHVCDLNPAAVADVCRAYLNPLLSWLAAKFAAVDPHFRQTAAHQALMDYVQRPTAYEPGSGDLASYLRMAARRDLFNLLKREGKHQKGRVDWAVVEDEGEGGNLSREEEPSVHLQRAEEAREWEAFLEGMVQTFTLEERRVLELMLAGERKTQVYGEAPGLEGLAAGELEREVKKVKDRIKKRLERGVPRHD